MSYDDSDARDDAMVQAMYDSFFDDRNVREAFHESLYDEIVKDFTDARLRSFFEKEYDVALPAVAALDDARTLRATHETASFIFGSIATEVGLRATLLKPIVHGLVHTDAAAELITKLAMTVRDEGLTRVLVKLLAAHGGVDLLTHQRSGSSHALWQEIRTVAEKRNGVVHRAERAGPDDADLAIAVAGTILDDLFPRLVTNLGLYLEGRSVRGTPPAAPVLRVK